MNRFSNKYFKDRDRIPVAGYFPGMKPIENIDIFFLISSQSPYKHQ